MRPDTLPGPFSVAPPSVELAEDHPGFADPVYRARRDAIARAARHHVSGHPAPIVAYTDDEQATWRAVWDELLPLHRSRVCSVLAERGEELRLFDGPIPWIEDLNRGPLARSGFRFEPVEGLVPADRFFAALADGVFLSTQFMRHSSRPLYTPEPDVVHELVGHAASLTVPWIADLARSFGRAASRADGELRRRIDRVFWFTMEFGVVEEDGEPRAFGAGLLSSAGELARFDAEAELLPLDLERASHSEYDTDSMQRRLFVAPSIDSFRASIAAWLGRILAD
ncbi:MAG: phenylalanine 4-monooxygenase [Planctomycetota bacterium]